MVFDYAGSAGIFRIRGLCFFYFAIKEIPEWIGELEALEELNLAGNDIETRYS